MAHRLAYGTSISLWHGVEPMAHPSPSLDAGADSLRGDKLGSFMMSIEGGHAEAVRFMKQFGVPMLVTGGWHAAACSSPTSVASCCVLLKHWVLASWSVGMGTCSAAARCTCFCLREPLASLQPTLADGAGEAVEQRQPPPGYFAGGG